jgi:hypothetical protein
MTKPRLDSFAEKISPAQTQQLIEWLAEHTYSEVCDLVATEPPDGFGLQVSISTVCRFHKAHFAKVIERRQEKLGNRAAEQSLFSESHDEFYRENLNKGTTLSLQERLYEMLTRPVETIDDLKKLVYVCKEVKNLEIPLDPGEEVERKLVKELSGSPLDRFIPGIQARVKAMREAEAAKSAETRDPSGG